ncbi:MAG: hypothetical protein M3044_06635 [Thermoproteota archaeon]|nr:hypothetical protein [Thermoproteota archaeon]
MTEENNLIDKRSPYATILKDRKKVVRSTIKNTADKPDMSNLERKKCSKCHDYFAYPKLDGNTWYYVCSYPICQNKEKIEGIPVQTSLQRGELIPEHDNTVDTPLIAYSFDRKGKSWSKGRGSRLDDDFYSIFGGAAGVTKVSESSAVYNSESGWEQQ